MFQICEESCPLVLGQHVNDLMESVALVETAIAHLLNAEGEKIQKAIACSCSVAEILLVNQSVLKTIRYTTYLEQILYCKLAILLEPCSVGASC